MKASASGHTIRTPAGVRQDGGQFRRDMSVMWTAATLDDVEEKSPMEDEAPVSGAFSSRGLLFSKVGISDCS